jgi:hypothetical protein
MPNDVPAEQTEEHIFPKAIGGRVKLFPVHKRCNSLLGNSIDAPLADDKAVLVRRKEFDLRGNSGALPNPLSQVTLVNQDNEPFVYDPEKGFKRIRDVFKTEDRLTILFEVEPDLDREVQVDKFIKKMQRELARLNLDIPPRDELVNQFEELFQQNHLEADVLIKPFAHRPGLIKIAYELGVYWLGDNYLDDPKAIELRNFIIDPPENYPFLGDLEIVESDKFSVWDVFNQPKKHHIALLQRVEHAFVLKVRIFDVYEVTAVITENSDLYPVDNKFLCIDPRTKNTEECSLRKAYGIVSQITPSVGNGAWLDINTWFRSRRR